MFFCGRLCTRRQRKPNNWNHRLILMATAELSKRSLKVFLCFLYIIKVTCASTSGGLKKKKKKSGPRGQRSRPRRDNAHATTVGSAVQKTLRSLRQQRSANLIWANWCHVPGCAAPLAPRWAAQPSQELWLYGSLIAMKLKWPDNPTSLVSVSGIFIFNWLRWSFRPRSALYFRRHLTALTDISLVFFYFFIFLFTRLHETILSETAIKTLLPLWVKASPFSFLCNLWNGSTAEEWQPFRRDLF